MMRTITQLQSMEGRAVVITGGAGQLGSAMATALAELGANLILVDKKKDALELAEEKLRAICASVQLYQCDLEAEEQRVELSERIKKNNRHLSCLINNAAFVGETALRGWIEPFENQSLHTWRRAIEVNTSSVFHLTQLLRGSLERGPGANIINISSIYATYAPDWSMYENENISNPAAYAVSKAGLEQLTRWLASTLAPTIRVNAIAPGGIKRAQSQTFIGKYCERTPLDRMGEEEDIKGAVAFLATDLSSYVTGQVLAVNGGWGIW